MSVKIESKYNYFFRENDFENDDHFVSPSM